MTSAAWPLTETKRALLQELLIILIIIVLVTHTIGKSNFRGFYLALYLSQCFKYTKVNAVTLKFVSRGTRACCASLTEHAALLIGCFTG